MKLPGPNRVLRALESIRVAHPYAASGAIAQGTRADSDASAVWARLLSADGVQRDSEIERLTSLEESLVTYGASPRMGSPDALAVIGRVFKIRNPTAAGSVGWTAFLLSNGHSDLRPAASRFIEANQDIRAWRLLVQSSKPLEDACALYWSEGITFDKWIDLPTVRLSKSPLVRKALQRRLVEPHVVDDVVSREGIDTVERWVDDVFVDSEIVAWYRSYMEQTHTNNWALGNPILHRILDRFGAPSRGRPFWEEVSADAINSFEHWLKNLELTQQLGEGERVKFWRGFLPWIQFSVLARDEDAVFICFKTWFAVQYVAMGRATYMFDRRYLGALKRLTGTALYREILNTPALGRYAHRGYFWQWSAEGEVKRVLRSEME